MEFLDYEIIKVQQSSRSGAWYYKLRKVYKRGSISFNCIKIVFHYNNQIEPRGYRVGIIPLELHRDGSEHSALPGSGERAGAFTLVRKAERFDARAFESADLLAEAQTKVNEYAPRVVAGLEAGITEI